jgi:hypothetical protein
MGIVVEEFVEDHLDTSAPFAATRIDTDECIVLHDKFASRNRNQLLKV